MVPRLAQGTVSSRPQVRVIYCNHGLREIKVSVKKININKSGGCRTLAFLMFISMSQVIIPVNSGTPSAANLYVNRLIFYENHGAVLAIFNITTCWHKLIAR